MAAFQKVKHRITIGVNNSTPTFISKGIENTYSNKYRTQVFIAALFTTAKKWKQHKCPSTDEGINKMLYIHAMEYYSAIKYS